MVHVDAGDLDRRTELALNLAQRFDATLIGIAAWKPPPHFVAEGVIIDPKVGAADLVRMRTELDELGARFRARTGNRQRLEWRSLVDLPTDAMTREARAADLIIVGREYHALDPYRSLDPGAVVLKAGRPVLVVPSACDRLEMTRILIAWKDTREARRAVADAIPFLQHAQSVTIAEVCQGNDQTKSQQWMTDLARYLCCHGITTREKISAQATHSVAEELLRIAKDDNADLIVAGGYGHSRLGEWVLGGVTESLLRRSEVCCLFSH
jgi:nucleotide-binding universal stress UspA family protein